MTTQQTESYKQIYNPARFNQKADFGNVLMPGTDIDFIAEIGDRLYIMVEWKTLGAGMPPGQALCFKRLARDLGQVKPTFHVVAHHDTNPNDPIDGNNSFVTQVFYRLPNMTRADEYIYADEAPSLNEWLGDFSYEWRLRKVLRCRPVPLWEGIPKVNLEDWDRVSQPKGPSAFFDLIRPVRHSFEGLSSHLVPCVTGFDSVEIF